MRLPPLVRLASLAVTCSASPPRLPASPPHASPPLPPPSPRTVPQMGMKEDMAKVGAVAATLAASPMVASATEGTNEVRHCTVHRLQEAASC